MGIYFVDKIKNEQNFILTTDRSHSEGMCLFIDNVDMLHFVFEIELSKAIQGL